MINDEKIKKEDKNRGYNRNGQNILLNALKTDVFG